MANYMESKKAMDAIRSKYGCKGEILFRSAIQYVVEYGADTLMDDLQYKNAVDDVNDRHDAADEAGKTLFVSREFELAILECAREIAQVNTYDFLVYIQREVWLSNDGMDYQRAMELLKSALEYLEGYNNCNNRENYDAFCDIGLDDDEMELFGFDYLIPNYEEEEE